MAGSPSGYFQYRSPFGDTTLTKVFVGGLAWETPVEKMREYFQPFGEILEAVIICDKNTGKSKGYGFVTFRDPESAKRAVEDANPMIDGRRANCNIAANGRPRQTPPRGRGHGQSGQVYYPAGTTQGGSSEQGPLVAPPTVPVMYPTYGYTPYNPQFGYNQAAAIYSQQQAQYYQQMYGTPSSSTTPTMHQPPHHPFYYPYSMHAAAAAGGGAGATRAQAYSTLLQHSQPRGQGQYYYYSSPINQSPMAGSYSLHPHLQHQQQESSDPSDSTMIQQLPSQIESRESSRVTSPETEAKVAPSDSPISD